MAAADWVTLVASCVFAIPFAIAVWGWNTTLRDRVYPGLPFASDSPELDSLNRLTTATGKTLEKAETIAIAAKEIATAAKTIATAANTMAIAAERTAQMAEHSARVAERQNLILIHQNRILLTHITNTYDHNIHTAQQQ